jgi:anaerobic magnesium-protoporphyrin IX monomethyl ester cyclase
MPEKPAICFIAFYDEVALGVRTLQAVLERAGFKTRIIFFQGFRGLGTWPTKAELEKLFQVIENDHSDIFGLSFRSFVFPLAKMVTEEIKRTRKALVMWGGSHPTLVPEDCIQFADVVCVGEAEDAILEFMQALDERKDFSGIENLWVKTGSGIRRNPIRRLRQDIDPLPWPVYGNEGKTFIRGVEVINRDLMFGGQGPASYYILGSRGCPFACDYCCNAAFQEIYAGAGPYIRKRSPENIIAELEHATRELDVAYLAFEDELFTLDKSWALEVCRLYKERIRIPFSCQVHPGTIDQELAEALGEAGVRVAVIGVQSGSERVRREVYNRHISNHEILKAGKLLKDHGALVHYDFIFDNPYETKADLQESFGLLLKIPRPNFLEIFSLAFFPGTRITDRALRDNLIHPGMVEGASEKPSRTFLHRFEQSINHDVAFYSMLFWLSQLKFSFKHLMFFSYGLQEDNHPVHILPLKLLEMMERSKILYRHPGWMRTFHRFFLVRLNKILAPLRRLKRKMEITRK